MPFHTGQSPGLQVSARWWLLVVVLAYWNYCSRRSRSVWRLGRPLAVLAQGAWPVNLGGPAGPGGTGLLAPRSVEMKNNLASIETHPSGSSGSWIGTSSGILSSHLPSQGLTHNKPACGCSAMIKMMVIVVIVFTACWLPFNTLVVVWDNDESMGEWPGMPYLWFAFHWLAMSHSCYNPVIYCWMNARFRAGFCIVLDHVPCLRGILPARHRSSNTSSVTGIALTGVDAGTESSILHRVNTCTTYISMRRKNPHHMGNNCSSTTSPARSASVFRHQAAGAHHNGHRRLSRLDSNPLEDQI